MTSSFAPKKIPLSAPGPSPWYLRAPWAAIRTARGTYTWGFHDGPKLDGLSFLIAPDGQPVLLLDFYWYVLNLAGDRLLVWHEIGREQDAKVVPHIEFIILDLDGLRPLANSQAMAEEMRSNKENIAFEGGKPISFSYSTNVGEGIYPLAPPALFLELPEVLVLADFGAESGNHYDKMFRAIFAFDFKAHRVSVIPQRWFNEGRYDFGYQWITRVQREVDTGQIVGEGIRLRNFRLDRSGNQVQEWLNEDDFYHPGHDV